MTDDPFFDRIEEYLDGDLPAGEAEAFERHVEGCAECRREIGAARRLVRLAAAAPPVPIPADLGDRIRERLDPSRGVGRRRGRLLAILPYLGGAAAAAVLLLLLWPAGRSTPPPAEGSGAPPAMVAFVRDRDPHADREIADELADWLVQARNAEAADVPFLAAEARDLRLLERVRAAGAAARGGERRWLRAGEDLLVQLLNDPGADALAGEARLVAMGRGR